MEECVHAYYRKAVNETYGMERRPEAAVHLEYTWSADCSVFRGARARSPDSSTQLSAGCL